MAPSVAHAETSGAATAEDEVLDLENAAHMSELKAAAARQTANPSPEDRAGPVSWVLFMWVTSIFRLAQRKRKKEGRELEQSDLWDLPNMDHTSLISTKFANAWTKKKERLVGEDETALLSPEQASSNLTTSLWAVIGTRMWAAGIIKLLNSLLQFTYPLFINEILRYIQQLNAPGGGDLPWWRGYAFAVGFGFAMALKAITENSYFFLSFRAGWQVRSVVTTEVYQKALRLSASARQTMTLGQIVNLMQLDSTKLEMFVATSFHVLWDAVFQIAGYMVILYFYIGWSAFVGLGVMVVAIPVQGVIFSKLQTINRKMVKVTDDRVKLTNEVLQGILGIKMAAWEHNYANVINGYRSEEIKHLKSTVYLTAFSMAYMMAMPAIVAVAAISAYAVSRDGDIDAATLFTALSAFGQLRFPLMFFPNALNALAQARVSRKRVADFFALDEISRRPNAPLEQAQDNSSSPRSRRPVVVKIEDGQFFWARPTNVEVAVAGKSRGLDPEAKKISVALPGEQGAVVPSQPDLESGEPATNSTATASEASSDVQRPALDDINVEVRNGSLVAIVGPVGCGKSSLVGAIINELHCARGSVGLSGSVAYAAQTAWIFNDTVRNNILFGEPMDEKRYRRVLRACQLSHDLEVLQDGDQTMIGERGINLSGGQKQRISVARAAYSRKDIVILDDPLSALDPEVARRMFNECILKLLKDRTRILVTNQLNFLPQCDKVIVLEAKENEPGRIVEQGKYAKLLSSGLDFSKLMAKFNGASHEGGDEAEKQAEARADAEAEAQALADSNTADVESVISGYDSGERRLSSSMMESVPGEEMNEEAGKDLMQVEERQKGAVQMDEYLGYLRAGGGYCFAACVLVLFLVSQLANLANQAWVTVWADDNEYENFSFHFYLVGYALTAIVLAALTYLRGIMTFYLGLRASINMHDGLVTSVLHAPTSFFDTTPIGRIISRFSKDLYLIDTQVPMFYSFFLFTTTMVLFSIITIGYSTPFFLISVPVLGVLYLRFLNWYRPLARDSKRLESISRSPVFAHFSETLGGLSTIRSYNHASTFMADNATKVDENLKGWYLVKAIERWLAVRLELMGAVITILAACLAVYSAEQGTLSAGLAGLSLSFAMSITGLLNQTVRTFAELEAGMNSVERILFYTTGIEQEKSFESEKGFAPPAEWPLTGAVEIKDLSMRYRKDTPLVLSKVSLSIRGGERVGVCGRTGSGKSSLLLSFLRLVEPELLEDGTGPIWIDGVDVSKIGLHDLRSKISIVPQSPVLFSGTVRSNLDPFGKYNDEAIWDSLEQCAIKRAIEDSGGLDGEVSEYGENFSQGQRQLLCLARSILAQAKILLLDEATSSVDYETDAAIQSTIRNSFSECTIITIAHRLNTVIDSDKILVLDGGHVVEYASPGRLLSDPASQFSSMVSELGPSMSAKLRSQARRSGRLQG